jgi:Fe2+ or Zn2+ uptake regulation protein
VSDYSEHFAKHVRLVVLRLLAEASEYRLNDSILTDMTNAHGLTATRSQMRTEIAWLAEQGLITRAELVGGLVVATLAERGLDAAAGRANVPGVQRPAPKL